MVLIRLLLKTNSERKRKVHTIVFFIFIVANAGGLLLPTGDPPLFLGYLYGVNFLWTLRLWPQWLFVLGVLLVVYFLWDTREYGRESPADLARDVSIVRPIRVAGLLNMVWLVGVVVAVGTLDPSKPVPERTGTRFRTCARWCRFRWWLFRC
jgi:Na+/H+ antiporter NhaD/arsenite permease-like protein